MEYGGSAEDLARSVHAHPTDHERGGQGGRPRRQQVRHPRAVIAS